MTTPIIMKAVSKAMAIPEIPNYALFKHMSNKFVQYGFKAFLSLHYY
jgi:hypothetical protein